jgi:hypothetical protein
MASQPPRPRPLPELDDELREDWLRRVAIADRHASALYRLPRYGSPATLEAEDAMASVPMNLEGLKLFPVVGPGMDLYNDVRHGRGGAALGDFGLGLVDVLGLKGVGGLAKLAESGALEGALTRPTQFTAREVRDQFAGAGAIRPGQELHHSRELRGFPRDEPNWKNNPLLMKPLDQATHRRIHSRWAGEKRYDPIRRIWIGTQDWMKAIPAWLAAHGLDLAARPQQPPAPPRPLISTRTNPQPHSPATDSTQ